MTAKPLKITDVVLRDGHQSLLATRMRLDDMLPIAEKLDRVGFWSLETWGGATFDACIRYLGEDPWERIRKLKAAMPNTPQQMLFRGQNILGYRHYADDVVRKFVERAATNGVDVFRIFDAMNDMRNLETAIKATAEVDKHAQGTMSYTVSPVHDMDFWLGMARRLEDAGAHSIAIKDMAGLLQPYVAEELVSRLKENLSIPVAMQCHATTGLSTATIVKAVEAGIDMVDTSISSMSMTYGHSPTESVVSIFQNTERDTGLDLKLLEEIADYFREVRKKYAKFEGSLKGVDSRILIAQVPGGMLTNMENQLREQGAADKFDEVLKEIPRVREDLGYIALVTPTSQIVGTQSVINVLTGERYKSITKETAGVLKGEYGATPAPVNADLQARVLEGEEPITKGPSERLQPELEALEAEFDKQVAEQDIKLADAKIDDLLTYALFPQVGLKFLKNRDNPEAFEPVPGEEGGEPASQEQVSATSAATSGGAETYRVTVDGTTYQVEVAPGGEIAGVSKRSDAKPAADTPSKPKASAGGGELLKAPLAGTIFKVRVDEGQEVSAGDVLFILEAMKMETEVKAPRDGRIGSIRAREGDSVTVGDLLLTLE